MNELKIKCSSPEGSKASFTRIAGKLFKDYQLQGNANYYWLQDIEIYYHADPLAVAGFCIY